MARISLFIQWLFMATTLVTLVVVAISVTGHYRQFGCRTRTWGGSIINGDLIIARWDVPPPDAQGFFVGDRDWRLLFKSLPANSRMSYTSYHLWYYLSVYLLPILVLMLVMAGRRRLRYRTCRKLGWLCAAGCVLVAALWLVSYRSILYLAPWKGEFFVMDGFVRASPAGRRSYFDAAVHPNVHPSKDLFSMPVGPRTNYRDMSVPAFFMVPFWIPFSVGIASGFVLFRRKRIGSNCETCNYDLTGNTSGVCPECGTKINLTTASG